MNESLLKDEKILQKAKQTSKEYFEMNLRNRSRNQCENCLGSKQSSVQGVFHPTECIQKKNEGKKPEVWEKLKKKERELFKHRDDENIKQNIKILQTQFSMLINEEIEWKIKWLNHKHFEFRNKSGKLLVWQLDNNQQNQNRRQMDRRPK